MGFTAPLCSRGFTPRLQRQLYRIDRLLVPGLVETHGRVALLAVWLFASRRSKLPEALRYRGRCWLRSAEFGWLRGFLSDV